jgi:hypothetical protein
MPTDDYKSSIEFLEKMDAGELDGHFTAEIKKLSREQLEQLAHVLVERDEKRKG